MDTGRFNTQHDRFPLLELVAQFEYKTEGSIAFMVGEGVSYLFHVRGRLEVHHPCEGEFAQWSRVKVRGYLPAEWLTEATMTEVVRTLYSVLSIPVGEPHQARFAEYASRSFVVQDLRVVACTPG